MKLFEGKCGIKATVLADSISAAGIRFLTFEIIYPRLVLAELNTHRALSKNSFSSRAVPFEKMLDNLTGRPVRFGANQAGMQDKGEDFDGTVKFYSDYDASMMQYTALEAWEEAKSRAINVAEGMYKAGYHKQVYNRLLEPFQMMKTVISGTEWANFFWLRDDDAADPTLRELARVMREAKDASTPELLAAGEYHLPYVDVVRSVLSDGSWGPQEFYTGTPGEDDFQWMSLEEAIKVSCARCAAVSYRNEGYGLAKSLELYDRLVGSDKKHASALEHCATPIEQTDVPDPDLVTGRNINIPTWPETWQKGITHMDKDCNLWSGNIKGWVQYRKLIPGENYTGG